MRWVIVALLAGCYSPRSTRCEPCSGIAECPGGLACISGACQEALGACPAIDDAGGEPVPPGEPSACNGVDAPPFFQVCPAAVPPGTFTLPALIDTAADCSYIAPGSMCVIAAERIIGSTTTRVKGTNPLVLFARDQFELSGVLDLRGFSTDADNKPPAADANECTEMAGNNGLAGGGGPGATFRGRGGSGASGDAAAAKQSSTTFHNGLTLRGGCRGGNGGIGQTALAVGLGGNGGGAIYIAASTITISGIINASGGGARAGLEGSGAGGGGSGGMILLWSKSSASIMPSAQIFALGGGGGAGGGGSTGLGEPGDDPGAPNDPANATDPNQMSNGGAGGKGGSSTTLDGGTGLAGTNGAGGGGGGSTGFIKVIPAKTGAQFGPPPS